MASGKKLINSAETCVDEMLQGFALAHPKLTLHVNERVILVQEWENNRNVAIISGGGSGHEPFCAGYVGKGMLTAIAAGSIFASPPSGSILHMINCVAKRYSKGVLVIIANYTGDFLNFGLAVEQAKSQKLKVESVVVGEDCALLEVDNDSRVGRRGMCGLLFVYKIAGAMSELGIPLEQIASTTQEVINSMATMGVGLSACSLPGSGPLFTLKENEMELGLGVHGEAGIQRLELCSATETTNILLSRLKKVLSLKEGDDVVVLINNLGASSQLEQWLISGEVHKQLSASGIRVHRMYAGHLMTSLDMAGIQVSLLKLADHMDTWLNCLDAYTEAAAWPGSPLSIPRGDVSGDSQAVCDERDIQRKGPAVCEHRAGIIKHCLQEIAAKLIENEDELNKLDSGCGDGDCGSSFHQLAQGILDDLDKFDLNHPASTFMQLALISESKMGGTSGAIYGLFFTTAAAAIEKLDEMDTPDAWSQAWLSGVGGIMHYSQARLGDRTMLDALVPACLEFEKQLKKEHPFLPAIKTASRIANEGCKETKNMKARVGRASYVNPSCIKNVDAGAYAVAVWLNAIYTVLEQYFQ